MSRATLLVASLAWLAACAGDDAKDTEDTDVTPTGGDADTDADADTDTDTDTDTDADADPIDTADPGLRLLIHEILADPGTYDASCDGNVDASDDEFVEIVNIGTTTVDLSGATLSDLGNTRHTFPTGTVLDPWDAVVVFGGGTPTLDGTAGARGSWCVALPPEVEVQTASTGLLSLDDNSDTVSLSGPLGTVLDVYTYGTEASYEASISRSPELTSAPMVEHRSLPGATARFSPGTLANGAGFDTQPPADTGAPPVPTGETGLVVVPTGETAVWAPTGETGLVVPTGETGLVYDTAPPPPPPDTAPPPAPVDTILPGQLVINEVLQNPLAVADGNGEWFEVYNASGVTLELEGLVIRDDGGEYHVVSQPLTVGPGGYLVFGVNADPATNGGVSVDYEWNAGIFLGNADDELILENALGVIDRVAWDGGTTWPDPDGATMTLDPGYRDATSNDDGGYWCFATSPFGAGDLGTPGAGNDPCFVVTPTGTTADTAGAYDTWDTGHPADTSADTSADTAAP